MNTKNLAKQLEKLVAKASFSLREDVSKLIGKAYRTETNSKAKKALSWIIENASIAKEEKLAICQDTGFPVVFIEAGRGVKVDSYLLDSIKKGLEIGYKKNNLRPSVVDPLIRGRSSYKGMIHHLDFSSSTKGLKITILPKGFGSENKSQLKMFNPTVSIEEIGEFVVDAVKKAGPESCPPFVVGVGIGGTSDKALVLAKKALIERVDQPNPDKLLNLLEKNLFRKINTLNIGPMGFGGKNTCLAVKVKRDSTHIAGLPVGVNISCHALRSATINIK